MVKLLLTSGFLYAIYLNYSGLCDTGYSLGCVNNADTLILAFALYLFLGVLFFIKRRLNLFGTHMHVRAKRVKFSLISLLFLMAGLGIMTLFAGQLMGKNLFANLSSYL